MSMILMKIFAAAGPLPPSIGACPFRGFRYNIQDNEIQIFGGRTAPSQPTIQNTITQKRSTEADIEQGSSYGSAHRPDDPGCGDLDPEIPARYYLAYAKAQQGHIDEARQILEAIPATGAQYAKAQNLLSILARQR
jgi:hypothetical protein